MNRTDFPPSPHTPVRVEVIFTRRINLRHVIGFALQAAAGVCAMYALVNLCEMAGISGWWALPIGITIIVFAGIRIHVMRRDGES